MVPKDDKIGKLWVIFNLSGSRLSGCKRSTMAEVSLAQTHTDEQESGCTVICFAITHKMCASCHRGGGWVLQKNLIAKAFICQLLALKSFPAPFFFLLYMRDINRVLFHVDKKTREVSGGRSRQRGVCVCDVRCVCRGSCGVRGELPSIRSLWHLAFCV